MNAFDDLPPLDTDRLMNDMYALQASLSMACSNWREPGPMPGTVIY